MRWFPIVGLFIVALAAWATDFVTLQGERTIYTVECKGGAWAVNRCGGTLVASDRYRYRALKAHGEVIFWVAGSSEPSGKLAQCTIEDGRNWSCPANSDTPRSITVKMAFGHPVNDPAAQTKPFHAVTKLVWLLASCGLWPGSTSDSVRT